MDLEKQLLEVREACTEALDSDLHLTEIQKEGKRDLGRCLFQNITSVGSSCVEKSP